MVDHTQEQKEEDAGYWYILLSTLLISWWYWQQLSCTEIIKTIKYINLDRMPETFILHKYSVFDGRGEGVFFKIKSNENNKNPKQ